MKKITITNDYHNTSATVREGALSDRTIRRVRMALCPRADCRCADGPLNERGPQKARIDGDMAVFAPDARIDNDL